MALFGLLRFLGNNSSAIWHGTGATQRYRQMRDAGLSLAEDAGNMLRPINIVPRHCRASAFLLLDVRLKGRLIVEVLPSWAIDLLGFVRQRERDDEKIVHKRRL